MTNKFGNVTFGSTSTASTDENGTTGGAKVDWTALNKHVADTVQEAIGCEEGSPASVIGILSGVVDFGRHQDDLRVEPLEVAGDTKGNQWRSSMVTKGKATLDDNGMFNYQAPAQQEVGFFVDFPSITVDKGQFFGETNPSPYRVFLGGDFAHKPSSTKVSGYPNSNNVWVFSDLSRATTLAKAAGLKDLKDGFAQNRLLELIGKPMVFSTEVFINAKEFLTEKVTKPTRLMAGMPVPEYNDDLLFYVGMHEDNDPAYVKMVPKTKSVKSYMQSALDYTGSKLEAQFIAQDGEKDEQPKQEAVKTPEPKKEVVQETKINYAEPEVDFQDDIPF